MTAVYDAHADWYEEYVTGRASAYGERVAEMLTDLLGQARQGQETCLDVGCGNGIRAATLQRAGWRPIGVDVSTGQLSHARGREPAIAGDARALPIADGSAGAAVCVLIHTDVQDYAAVVREAARTLKPGGRFVHIGVHPCFCGYFADWSTPDTVLLTSGYTARVHSFEAWTSEGVRARVGAWHLTLADLVNTIVDAELRITSVREGGGDPPAILGIAAEKPRR
jgi:ubiquinone/menaquinone biosynthesis C-methylase UbiE